MNKKKTVDVFLSEKFSKHLKAVRYRKELSLRKMAKDAGVSFATLNRIENGGPPDIKTFCKLCNYFMVSPSMFIRNSYK